MIETTIKQFMGGLIMGVVGSLLLFIIDVFVDMGINFTILVFNALVWGFLNVILWHLMKSFVSIETKIKGVDSDS